MSNTLQHTLNQNFTSPSLKYLSFYSLPILLKIFKMMMMIFSLFFLFFLGFTGGQESFQVLTLYDSYPVSHNGVPVAVSLGNENLYEVSRTVSKSETWLRNNVLNYYPATNITTIVVGHTIFCDKNQQHKMGLVLLSIKNIYYSLTRWGLEKEIKVSTSFSSDCLQNPIFTPFVKSLLSFLQATDSPYSLNPPPFSDETLILITSHSDYIKKLGFFNINKFSILINGVNVKEAKPTTRKPLGYSVPEYTADSALPPLIGAGFPLPELAPEVSPASPPFGFDFPPCNPSGGNVAASPPEIGRRSGLWCVAKPSVPADTLQEAMDYACGEGGADCEEIKPNGSCYSPDSLVAHASYAFNSYWQKNKDNGGTCGFGGTAMLISSDPSFSHCRFILG